MGVRSVMAATLSRKVPAMSSVMLMSRSTVLGSLEKDVTMLTNFWGIWFVARSQAKMEAAAMRNMTTAPLKADL